MVSVKVISILGIGFVAFCVISSTTAATEEESTTIGSVTKAIKSFFGKVKKLDRSLHLPEAMKKFKEIKFTKDHFWNSIKSDKKYLDEFRTQYLNLINIAMEVVKDYEAQMDTILVTRLVGKQSKRIAFCFYYQVEFVPKLTIEGEGAKDLRIGTGATILKTYLDVIYVKIHNMAVQYLKDNPKTRKNCGLLSCLFK